MISEQVLRNSISPNSKEEVEILIDPETIINALENIGTTSAIEVLLEILPLNCYPQSFVINTLANIAGLDIIPHLWEIQLKSQSPYFFDAIANIQKSHQYYNPKYCDLTPQRIDSDATQKCRNYRKNHIKYDYSRLSDYQFSC